MPILFQTSNQAFIGLGVSHTIIVPAPAGIVAGDLLVMSGLVNTFAAGTFSVSNGFVVQTTDKPGTNPTAFVASKIAGVSEPATYTVVFSAGPAFQAMNVGILRFDGACGVELPIVPLLLADAAGVTITAPSIISVKDKNLIIRSFMFDTTGTEPSSVITPAGTTLREAIVGPQPPFSSDPQGHIYTDDVLLTPPGPTGTAIITLIAHVGLIRSVAYTIAVEETPSGSGGTMGGPVRDKSGKLITKAEVLAARAEAVKTGAKIKTTFDPRRSGR